MKKILMGICALVLLVCSNHDVSAELVTDLLLLSETESENVWYLHGVIDHVDPSLEGTTLTANFMEQTASATIGSSEGWFDLSADPDPSIANGEVITVQYGDTTFTGRIPSTYFPEGYNGVIQIPTTYNLRVITAGSNPVIGWSNDFNTEYPSYAPIDQYRIRVYDQYSNMLLSHPIRSSEVDLSSPDQTFDFSTIEFTFEEGVFYTIRVETREYTSFYDEANQEIDPIENEYAEYTGILNRNRVDIKYQLLNGQNVATIFSAIGIYSDTTISEGWVLNVNPTFIANPVNNPTVTIDSTAAINVEIPLDSEGDYWGPVLITPSEANGKSTTWSADGQTVSADIPNDSIIEMPISTNLQIIGGTGENPIISWENSYQYIDHFRIRVYETGVIGYLIKEDIYDFNPGEVQRFDFNSIGFSFEPGKAYTIRVEARSEGIALENVIGVGSAYIVNRSKADIPYENPDGTQGIVILTENSPNVTIPANNNAKIYCSEGVNSIIIESGAVAQLYNAIGNNMITIQSDSSQFTVSRSGTYVTIDGMDDTLLIIPATSHSQNIIFNDRSMTLTIDAGRVMLGSQQVDLTTTPIVL